MKYNKSFQINDKENQKEIKYKKKEKYKSPIWSKKYSNNVEGKDIDLNLFQNNNKFSSFKSRFFQLLSNDQNRTQAIRYLRNSFREKESYDKTMIEKNNSEKILFAKKIYLNKNTKIIKDYSPNYSNFDNKLETDSNQSSTNGQYKKIPPLDFKKLSIIRRFATDKNFKNNKDILTKEESNMKDANNQKSNSKNIQKNKFVICTNNFVNKNNSSLNIYEPKIFEHERNKTDRLYINKNDFHNYIKLGSLFVNTSTKKKKNSIDKGFNHGNQTERLNNKNIEEIRKRKIDSLIGQGRINQLRKKRMSSDLDNYYDEYYYNNTYSNTNKTSNNFYPQKNLKLNFDKNINGYYLTQRTRKSSSNIISNQNGYFQPKQIKFFEHNLIPTNENQNQQYINASPNTFNEDNNLINNENYEFFSNPNTYDNINSNEIKSKIETDKFNQKGKLFIINKFNNKLFIKKRAKENKNIETLKTSSFELAFNGNENLKKETKNGIYLVKFQKGQPIYEILIDENNMKNVNKFFVEEKIMVKDSLIELNLKNEINDIRQKYEQLQNELNQMKENISVYQKKNDELMDIIKKIKNNENKKDELSDEKNTIKEDKFLNNLIGYNLENSANIKKIKEDDLEKNKKVKRKYKRREIGEKND